MPATWTEKCNRMNSIIIHRIFLKLPMCWTRLWPRCLLRPYRIANTSRTCTRASNWQRRSCLRFLECIKLGLIKLDLRSGVWKAWFGTGKSSRWKIWPKQTWRALPGLRLSLTWVDWVFLNNWQFQIPSPDKEPNTVLDVQKVMIHDNLIKCGLDSQRKYPHLCRLATFCKEEQSDLRLLEFLGNLEKFCETGTKAHFVLTQGDFSETW